MGSHSFQSGISEQAFMLCLIAAQRLLSVSSPRIIEKPIFKSWWITGDNKSTAEPIFREIEPRHRSHHKQHQKEAETKSKNNITGGEEARAKAEKNSVVEDLKRDRMEIEMEEGLDGLLQILLFMCLRGITVLFCVAKSSEGVFVGAFLSMSLTVVVFKFLKEQSSLTGESILVIRRTYPVLPNDCELPSKECVVFARATVVNGYCICIVVNTGMSTETGQIQTQIQEASLENNDTPLKKKLDEFGERFTTVIGFICRLVWVNFLFEKMGVPDRKAASKIHDKQITAKHSIDCSTVKLDGSVVEMEDASKELLLTKLHQMSSKALCLTHKDDLGDSNDYDGEKHPASEAYMLMYSQIMLAKDSKECNSSAAVAEPMDIDGSETLNMNSPSLPENLRQEVEELNKEYDKICEEYGLKKYEVLLNVAERKREVRTIFAETPVCLNSLEESLDGSTEIAHQLFDEMPGEGEKFQIVDQTWRDIMKKTAGAPGCLDAWKDAKRLQKLKEANRLLEIINKGLASYVEDKWVASPRFFFLSNDEMLEILSETKHPLRVQPHLKKCFEGINALRFEHNLEVTAMISAEGETVPLTDKFNPKSDQGAVEKWLLQAKEGMLQSVQDQCAKSVVAYAETEREKWMLNWPEQVVLVVSAIYWTRSVTESIWEGRSAVANYENICTEQLGQIESLIRGTLTINLEKMRIGCAIGVLHIDSKSLRNSLLPFTTRTLDVIKGLFLTAEKEETLIVLAKVMERIQTLQEKPSDLDGFANFINQVPTDDEIKNDDLHDSVQCYGDSIESTDLFIEENKNSMMGELDKQVYTLNEELIEILGALHSGRFLIPESDPTEIVAELEEINSRILEIQARLKVFRSYQKLFQMVVDDMSNFAMTEKEYNTRYEKEVYRMGKANKEDTVVFRLKDSIDDSKKVLPLIEELTNEALKGRHWTQISGLLGQTVLKKTRNLRYVFINYCIKLGFLATHTKVVVKLPASMNKGDKRK
eukprot:Gb_13037 [translate_table: standard]